MEMVGDEEAVIGRLLRSAPQLPRTGGYTDFRAPTRLTYSHEFVDHVFDEVAPRSLRRVNRTNSV